MGALSIRAAELSQRLAQNVQAVCRHYLPAGRREGRYWMIGDVAGSPGRSLYVRLFETERGRIGNWVDAATGEHGDLVDLIRFNQRHTRLSETIDEAERFLALPPSADHGGASWWYAAGLVASAACALLFCALNLRTAGVPLVALGLMLNAAVVARNGAMPVSIFGASRAGVSTLSIATGSDPRHTIAGVGSSWRSLGDVIPVPLPLAPEVVSPGDVLVAAGLAEFVFVTSRRRRSDGPPGQTGGATDQAPQTLSTIAPRS